VPGLSREMKNGEVATDGRDIGTLQLFGVEFDDVYFFNRSVDNCITQSNESGSTWTSVVFRHINNPGQFQNVFKFAVCDGRGSKPNHCWFIFDSTNASVEEYKSNTFSDSLCRFSGVAI
jgi:hypothetical protein